MKGKFVFLLSLSCLSSSFRVEAQTAQVTGKFIPVELHPSTLPTPQLSSQPTARPIELPSRRTNNPSQLLRAVSVEETIQENCPPLNTQAFEGNPDKAPMSLEECLRGFPSYRNAYNDGKAVIKKRADAEAAADNESRAKNKAMEKIEELASLCEKEAGKAKSACMGTEISPMVQALASQFEQSRTAGDVAKACSAAKRLNAISMGANLSVGVMCQRAYPKCTNTCNEAKRALNQVRSQAQVALTDTKQFESLDRNIEECGKYRENVGQTYMQGLANVGGYAQSQQCLRAVALTPTSQPAICEAANASDNPLCIDKYCAVAGREQVPICRNQVAEVCADPSMAQNLFCRCKGANAAEDPDCRIAGYTQPPPTEIPIGGGGGGRGPGGNNGLGGGIGAGNGPSAVTGLGIRGGVPDLPELPPDAGQLAPLANNGNGNGSGLPNFSGGGGVGGGGFSGSGSGAAPRRGSGDDEEESGAGVSVGGGGGQPDGPLPNKNDGSGGSGGGALAVGSGGGEENANPLGGFDLSAFMPKDESRLPASGGASDLTQHGISDANGLSNWEKVTRKMNEKRRNLRN